MSEKQPEALRLAAILGNEFDTYTDTLSAKEAAAELRRLHEVNVELMDSLQEVLPMLEQLLMIRGEPEPGSIGHKARAAIAKAIGA